jgi:Fe-Mn family superoxide dismutase
MDALEPVIDARTVGIHYTKHHAGYLKNLNAALDPYLELSVLPLPDILKDVEKIPEAIRTAVKNNGGGFYNHNLYWESMCPGMGNKPVGTVETAIRQQFGSVDFFKQEFEKAGVSRFGSGYAWLSKRPDGTLLIHSTANQDTPLAEGLAPLLVVDVWEHAYYLQYQNRRLDYLSSWWGIVNWQAVEQRFQQN